MSLGCLGVAKWMSYRRVVVVNVRSAFLSAMMFEASLKRLPLLVVRRSS